MTIDLNRYVGCVAINRNGQKGTIERNLINLSNSEYPFIHKFSDGSYNSLTSSGTYLIKNAYSRNDIVELKRNDFDVTICNLDSSTQRSFDPKEEDESIYDDDEVGYAYIQSGDDILTFGDVVVFGSIVLASEITFREFNLIETAIRIYKENT